MDGFEHVLFMILSIPCSPSPSSSVINTEGSLSLSPLPSPSLDAAQCRPNFWRIFPTSLDGRYGLDFVNVAQTSKILCGLRLYFSSVWRLPGYYYYQGFCSGNIHGPVSNNSGRPCPAIACCSTIISPHLAGCSIRAKLLLPLGTPWLFFHSSFYSLTPVLLIAFFFPPS